MKRTKHTDLIPCRDAVKDAAITLPPKTRPVATANAFDTAQSRKMIFQRLENYKVTYQYPRDNTLSNDTIAVEKKPLARLRMAGL